MVAVMGDKAGKKQISLKVDSPEGELVSKLAALRRVSVEKLFKQTDVNDFLTHLYLEELRKETERVEGGVPPSGGTPVAKRGKKGA